MDNLTHSLVGVLLARAGLNRPSPGLTPMIVFAANAPDLDIVAGAWGQLAYLEHHRGWTHSMLAAPLFGLALLALWRLLGRKSKPGPRQMAGAFVSLTLAALSNPLLDLPNVYGTRFLLPFRRDWLHFDFVHVIDVWLWVGLLLAVLAPLLSRLVNSEIGAPSRPGRTGAWLALALLAGYFGLRFELRQRAVETVAGRLYGGSPPKRVAVIPSMAAPWEWTGLVETSTAWRMVKLDLRREFDPEGARVFYKPEDGERLSAVRQTGTGRVFLDFSQWPMWRVVPVSSPEGGARVTVHDLRFGDPEEARFMASFLLDARNRVVEEEFFISGSGRLP